MQNFRVLIPAGGRSSRSGLNYPKTLYKLGVLPILIRICKLVAEYDQHPVIIINPVHETQFRQVLDEYRINAELVFQSAPKGMGDAVLQADNVINDNTNIILIWSDIPLLNKQTLKRLIDCHTVSENEFSFVTALGNNCYTIVERENGKLARVKETRALGIPPAEFGERDIGLFVFRKKAVFELLKKDSPAHANQLQTEHGFLDIIEKLIAEGKKTEGYPIALSTDVLSFNTPEELAIIENILAKG